jgi:glycosyltransferase involved in cell wall biosynthesis
MKAPARNAAAATGPALPDPATHAVVAVVDALAATTLLEVKCEDGRRLAAIRGLCRRKLTLAGLDRDAAAISRGKAATGLDLRLPPAGDLAALPPRGCDVVLQWGAADAAGVDALLRLARQAVILIVPSDNAMGAGEACLDLPLPPGSADPAGPDRLLVLRPRRAAGKAPDWNRLAATLLGSALRHSLDRQGHLLAEHRQLAEDTHREAEARQDQMARADRLEHELLAARTETAKLSLELARLRGSAKYRIGNFIVGAVRLPYRLLTRNRRKPPGSKKKRATLRDLTRRAPRNDPEHNRQELELYGNLLLPRRRPVVPEGPAAICYVLHNSLPYTANGYATRARGVASGLAANGVNLTVLTRPGFPFDQKLPNLPPDVPLSETVAGVRHERILEPRRSGMTAQDYVVAAADAFERRFRQDHFTAIMAASPAATCALPALIAARRLGLPFFYEVRGLWEITRASRDAEFAESEDFKFQAALEHLVATHADHVFTLTEPMREELIERGVARDHVSLVPNSCDIERFSPLARDRDLAASLGIPPEVTVIGYVGSFVDYEGLDDLVAAAGLLLRQGLDFRLLLVGSESGPNPEGALTRKLRQMIADEGLSRHVIMPGRVPHDMVERYYSLIDIAPFPRKPWPVCEMVSPLKPLEAMAMEKTVLVSSVRALNEMVAHGETGWVFEKGNTRSLADELARLIADPALRRRMGDKARRWVASERTWQRSTRAMAEKFTQAQEQHGPADG